MNHRFCLRLLTHFLINHSVLYNKTGVRYTGEQRACLVQLCFKYECPRNQSQKCIFASGSSSLKARTTIFWYGHNFKNFAAFCAAVIETAVSCTSRLRDFLGDVPRLAPLCQMSHFCQHSSGCRAV